MNDENKIGYYAIIPATILFNEQLKANEKLLYAVITVLSNKEGYCFASNGYLGNLLNSQAHTISKWISNLKKLGFVYLDIIKNEKGEIIQRRIYPSDTPYTINRTYPYGINRTEGMSQKGQYNNISINKIDRLFNYIINKEKQIPNEFSNYEIEIQDLLNKYELMYTQDSLQYMRDENIEKVKILCYSLALLVKENISYLSNRINREQLLSLYDECKLRQQEYKDTDNEIMNFTNYFYKSLKNQLLKGKDPYFFSPKKEEQDEEESEEEL